MKQQNDRFWNGSKRPATKAEFFNAITTPPAGDEGTVATIRLYGPIDSWGGWWGVSAKDFGSVLDALPSTVERIVLRLNSPGGEVFEALSILNMLRAHKAKVTAVVDGYAASAASVVAAGCDETVMSPGTMMMIHSASTITWGNAAQIRKDAEVLDSIDRSISAIYEAKAGKKDWPALLADTTWMTAEETVELGLADRIAVVPDAGESSTVGDDPEVVVIEPIEGDTEEPDDSAVARFGPLRERFAARAQTTHTPPSSSEPVAHQKKEIAMSDNLKAGIIERLGVTDADASEETLLAALDEALEERADTPAAPENTQLIDSGVLATLQADAAAGRQAREEQNTTRRDGIVDRALNEGRITPAARESWRAMLDSDEEGTAKLLNSLAANSAVPVSELGTQPAEASGDDAEYYSLFPDERPTTKEA